jgi:2-dehydro-3-deoxy-L-rhamnonate dehydrogenase (NAD+)
VSEVNGRDQSTIRWSGFPRSAGNGSRRATEVREARPPPQGGPPTHLLDRREPYIQSIKVTLTGTATYSRGSSLPSRMSTLRELTPVGRTEYPVAVKSGTPRPPADADVAFITGGGSGIGRAVAAHLAATGASVIVADADGDAAERVAHALGASATQVDVTNCAGLQRAVEDVVAHTGRLTILVNSAGIAGRSAPSWEIGLEEWDRVIAVNLSGTYYACRAVLPHMRSQHYGRIVNISSIAGKEGNPNAAAYSASKAGVIGLTKALAKEVVDDGVIVNCVTPAVIDTEMLSQVTAEHRQYMLARIPMKRAGTADEVAELVTWLASRRCSFSTGAVFDISGGRATY